MSISSDHIIDVYVDGKQLKGAVLQHVTSITVAESFERLDMMEVVFAVPDKGKSRDDVMDLAKHGAKLKMDMKSDGKSGRVLEGTVVEVGYDGGSGHGMHMSLRGLSLLTKVKSTQFAKVHEGDDAAVIKAIASEAGLGADVQGVDGTTLVLLALAFAAVVAALTAVFALRAVHRAPRLGGKGIATLALGVSIILGLAPVLLLVAIGLAGGAGLPS